MHHAPPSAYLSGANFSHHRRQLRARYLPGAPKQFPLAQLLLAIQPFQMTGEIPVTHTRLTMSHYHFKRTQPTINEPVYNNRGQKRDRHYDKENDIHRLAKPEFDTIPKKHPQTQQKNRQEPPCDRGRGSPIYNRGFSWIQRRLIRSRKEPVVM